MDQEIKAKLEEELRRISDMFESAGVRGEQFKRLSIAAFESNQVMEMVGHIVGATNEEDGGFVKAMVGSVANLLYSIVIKMADGMTKADAIEALAFGGKVHDRKIALQDQISKLM